MAPLAIVLKGGVEFALAIRDAINPLWLSQPNEWELRIS